jgi:phenylacetate-coenzyme A ligase PaaK-like adenylate-forming protein
MRAFAEVRLGGAFAARRERLRRRRLAEIVAWSRRRSLAYAELYAGLPDRVVEPERLPVTRKAHLMERFDRWVTDPRINRRQLESFMAQRENLGRPFGPAGALACRTSGSSGVHGVILHDRRALSVYAALWLARGYLPWLGVAGLARASLWRTWVSVMADGEHFTGAAFTRWAIGTFGRGGRSTILPTALPRAELASELARLRPAVLSGYPSKIEALVMHESRPRLDPELVVLSAEGFEERTRVEIAQAFGCPVRASYTASEFPAIAFECGERWLHVNDDFALLEVVDEAGAPVPPGTPSATLLITNLVNRIQPIVRYDLGDRAVVRPDPCPCGSNLPAIRVQGRKQELFRFDAADGSVVGISSNDVLEIVESVTGVTLYQVIQTGRREVRVRLQAAEGYREGDLWERARERLRAFFAVEGLPEIAVERDPTPPRPDARSGKFHAAWSEVPAGEPTGMRT